MLSKPFAAATLYKISQRFGVNPQWYQPDGHPGVDWTDDYGTPLLAGEDSLVVGITTPGVITDDPEYMRRGFGISLRGDSGLECLYWHCLPIFPVNVGDNVRRGQIVAYMGNSGFVTVAGGIIPVEYRSLPPYRGTHVHQEVVKDGKRVDPLNEIDMLLPIEQRPQDFLIKAQVMILKIAHLLKEYIYKKYESHNY